MDQTIRNPDFYIASMDYTEFNNPRACWRIHTLETELRNDLVLVTVHPPVLHRNFHWKQVVLAPRWPGQSVLSIQHWPVHVEVALGPQGADQSKHVTTAELESIAWGQLFPTEDEARRSVNP